VVLHPVFVGAVAVLLLNDHVLKSGAPGLITGKLSDLAGLIVLPLLVLALAQVASRIIGLPAPSRRFLAVCVVGIGVMFTLGEIMPLADRSFERLWGIVRSPIGSLRNPDASSAVLVSDPTDVLALPALWIAWVVGRARCARVEVRPHWATIGRGSPGNQGEAKRRAARSPRPLDERRGLHVLPWDEPDDCAAVPEIAAGRGHPCGLVVVPATDPDPVTHLKSSIPHA
jgi:hypothetical protein